MKIKSFKGEYEVEFKSDLILTLDSELVETDVIFIDKNVMQVHAPIARLAINSRKHEIVSPSESSKSYEALIPIIERLIQAGFRKNHRLIAIGGGITQDIVSFIASILYRGVDWLFIPTNLLSQCDSCIGSKTSINFREYKNQIGGFHPPRRVFISLDFLRTLSDTEKRSGLGEMIHYFFISGRKHFNLIKEKHTEALNNHEVLGQLIKESLNIKKKMIELDEFNKGPRNVFNYGHSFGHAIESYTNYSVPHGVAVTYGMDIANHLSVRLGFMTNKQCEEMSKVLAKNWGPTKLPNVDLGPFLELLKKDKKNIDNQVRVVLSRGLGDMFLQEIEIDKSFRQTLADCFNRYN